MITNSKLKKDATNVYVDDEPDMDCNDDDDDDDDDSDCHL